MNKQTMVGLLVVLALGIGVGYYAGYGRRLKQTAQTEPSALTNEFSDEITIVSPRPNQTVVNPLAITGQARGTWYFEGEFSAQLLDEDGASLGSVPVLAQGEWMTEDFVPFAATLMFDPPSTAKGELVIQNSNPSGLPENEKIIRIPVVFGK